MILSIFPLPINYTRIFKNTQPVTSGAVSSAIGGLVSKDLINASSLITITNVSSTTHTVTKGTIVWNKCYAIKFNNGRYFVQGEVEIGNGYGCTISPNTDIKIRIDTNFPAYSFTNVIFNAVIGGYVGLISIYTRDIYDMWLRNISGTNIPWNNSNPLILKFSFWI
jgi:hypothetical protein